MEERYIYHWDDYDYIETIYDTKEEKEYTDMQYITCVLNEQDQENAVLKKALSLARKYMFNVMCAEDVPSEEWFIKCAKEMMKSE